MSTTTYAAIGDIRGNCGHEHKSIKAAEECRARDAAGCKSQGGYSDRRVRHADGSPLTGDEAERLVDIQIAAVEAR